MLGFPDLNCVPQLARVYSGLSRGGIYSLLLSTILINLDARLNTFVKRVPSRYAACNCESNLAGTAPNAYPGTQSFRCRER